MICKTLYEPHPSFGYFVISDPAEENTYLHNISDIFRNKYYNFWVVLSFWFRVFSMTHQTRLFKLYTQCLDTRVISTMIKYRLVNISFSELALRKAEILKGIFNNVNELDSLRCFVDRKEQSKRIRK